jgi:hypothetical protein
MKKEKIIIDSIAKWIASHKEFLPEDSLRGLSNLVNKDFLSIPQVEPTHELNTSGVCKSCNKSGISFTEFENSFVEWGINILNERPTANPEYDQAPVTSVQAFQNIAYIISNISNEKSYAFLGDDDFHSLLLAKLLPNLSITVFEADKRIGSKIEELARIHLLDVSVVEINMTNNIPENYHCQFDSFYTDPPYSKRGIFLFLYNGLLLLKDKRTSWGILAIPFTPLPLQVKELMVEVQHYLTQNGIFIEEVIPYFKKSPSELGIISGILKFQLIHNKTISMPPMDGGLYDHFY